MPVCWMLALSHARTNGWPASRSYQTSPSLTQCLHGVHVCMDGVLWSPCSLHGRVT